MKHMLLAVSGMTPQIITETLYGIYRQDPSRYPGKIEVITTGQGRDRLVKNLLGADSPLQRLQHDYQLPAITFDYDSILVPNGDDGQPLDDVRSEREQEIIADFITQRVRELTADPELAIHASLAGGRKTMGFALGYAMSLFGRRCDCLSHVLVNDPYESVPDFFYPTPVSVLRSDAKNQGQHDLSMAVVTLATIPLVLMREEMPTNLITSKNVSYTQTVERINRANALTRDSASVTLDFDNMALDCDGELVFLKPDCFAFYSWLAQDSKENPDEGMDPPRDAMKIKELDNRMAQFIRAAIHPEKRVDLSLSLNNLLELATDEVDRVVEMDEERNKQDPTFRVRGRRLLQSGDNTLHLNQDAADRPVDVLYKSHKNLWDRLLKETNQTLTDALGERLASHYQIVTVNSISTNQNNKKDEKEKGNRSRYDFKGIKILPDNIHFK